jgi:hypothetical protein
MPWRFIDDIPTGVGRSGRPVPAVAENGFVLPYLLGKLGDLELEIEDLASVADTLDDRLALRRLAAARDKLAAAADEMLLRRVA